MATRSNIAIVHADNTVQQIYCHWDGYYSHNGKILLNHYNTTEKVQALINQGSISSLRPIMDIPEDTEHSFDSPNPEITIFYHRDRGESLDIQTPKKPTMQEEFLYVWNETKNAWYAKDDESKPLRKLTMKMC